MKLKIFFICTIGSLFFLSCSKNIEAPNNFDVKTESTTYTITDPVSKSVTVRFNFSGSADFVTFYSGEFGKNYDYKDRIYSTNDSVIFSFSSALNTNGNGILGVFISQDFSGTYTKEELQKASWIDLNSQFISPNFALATSSVAVSSNAINLSSFQATDVKTYIAFKYAATAGAVQKKWTISNVSLTHKIDDNQSYVLLDNGLSNSSPGWQNIKVTSDSSWSPKSITSVRNPFSFAGAVTAAAAVTDIESWLVSGAVDLTKVVQDYGTPIKGIADNQLRFYDYSFSKAGVYNVVFLAQNSDINGVSQQVVKQITLTIQ